MDLLDEVCGPENWQRVYQDIGGELFCGVGINVDGQWVWKWDRGSESNIEKEKGESSDAFKRAAVNWGVGRFLYSIKAQKQGYQKPQPKPQAPPPQKPQSSVSDAQWNEIKTLRESMDWDQHQLAQVIQSRFDIPQRMIASKLTGKQADELIYEMRSLVGTMERIPANASA
jgi:hypothetical protein